MEASASTTRSVATEHHNACVLCSHHCGLRMQVQDNRVVGVRADSDNPITCGYMCPKAYALTSQALAAPRVQQPLKRTPHGDFEPISWDQAVSEIGASLRQIAQAHSPRALALLGAGGDAAEAASAFREVLGTPWWFTTFAQELAPHSLVDKWLFNASGEAWLVADVESSSYVVSLGTQPDPRRAAAAARADAHVSLQPGSAAYFLLAMAARIVQSELVDRAFLAEHAVHTEALLAHLKALDLKDLAARCDVPLEQLTAVADCFASAESACIDMDVEPGAFATLSAYLLRVVHVLTGNLGNRGGAVFRGLFAPRVVQPTAAGFTAPVSGIEATSALGPFGMFAPSVFPAEALGDHPERIRALIVESASEQFADSQPHRDALAQLDLLVVLAPALTETARLAHYVLPTLASYERWDVASFPGRYPEVHGQLRSPILRGPEQALSEAEIYARLARAAGVITRAPKWLHRLARRAHTDSGALAYFSALSAAAAVSGKRRSRGAILSRLVFMAYETLGPTLPSPQLVSPWLRAQLFALSRREDVLRASPEWRGMRNPFALGARLYARLLQHPQGTLVGRLDPERNLEQHCQHGDGKLHLSHADMLREIDRALAFRERPDARLPFVLDARGSSYWRANPLQREPAHRRAKSPHCAMSATDAEQLGLRAGDPVEVATERGTLQLSLAIDETLRPRHVTVPDGLGLEHPDHSGLLALHRDELARDPFTGSTQPVYDRCAVRSLAVRLAYPSR